MENTFYLSKSSNKNMEQFSLVFDTRRLNTFPSFVVLFKTQSEFGMVSIE